MIEILIAVYLSCFLASSCLVLWQYRCLHRVLVSLALRNLNANLEKVGMFWSVSKGDFSDLETGSVEKDSSQATRSLFLMGGLAFASLPGLFLLGAVVFSLHFLVKNRREKAVFSSQLVQSHPLLPSEVQSVVDQCKRL